MGILVVAFFSTVVVVLVAIGVMLLQRQNNTLVKYDDTGDAIGCFFVATVVFIALVSWLAPDLGYSRVPSRAEKYADRLNNDVMYQLIAADKDGSDQILLIKWVCKPSVYRTIRVKAAAPPVAQGKMFTLMNGSPIEINLPQGETPCKK